jgi:hypothetical protein
LAGIGREWPHLHDVNVVQQMLLTVIDAIILLPARASRAHGGGRIPSSLQLLQASAAGTSDVAAAAKRCLFGAAIGFSKSNFSHKVGSFCVGKGGRNIQSRYGAAHSSYRCD